jgi:hypothetical protein
MLMFFCGHFFAAYSLFSFCKFMIYRGYVDPGVFWSVLGMWTGIVTMMYAIMQKHYNLGIFLFYGGHISVVIFLTMIMYKTGYGVNTGVYWSVLGVYIGFFLMLNSIKEKKRCPALTENDFDLTKMTSI